MLRAATSPLSTGLSAMPMSAAPVRNPNAVACTSGGITALPAAYAVVIDVPMQRPTTASDAASVHTSTGHREDRQRRRPDEDGPRNDDPWRMPSQQPARELIPERAGERQDRKQDPGHDRHAVRRVSDLAEVQRQHRAEAAIDELQAEEHEHHQQEILECQDRGERRPRALLSSAGAAAAAPGTAPSSE